MLKSLLPKLLTKEDSSYQSVEELHEVIHKALKEGEIKNIALTGPFGSGKSSILQTLRKVYSGEFKFLPVSLATLQAKENQESESYDESEEQNEKQIYDKNACDNERLNRKIEYSILQQLIYREKASTVQNSRFKRIIHIDEKDVKKLSGYGVAFFLAYLIAFEPSWLRVDTIYNFFNLGRINIIFDILAVIYMLIVLYNILKYIIKSYGNSKLNKLNLKDGEIEIKEDKSIFNHHLDEILYFFQVTKYNVVIIEDLDRFGTPDIFLKLRELNLLINESKIVDRNVVFMYAVKDDIFINEERTKFFDYITTVIPVINPSNSRDKLKEALKQRGIEDGLISDNDLAEMAFFIQDMRILTNIANEFYQYKEKLCTANGQNLSMTKLLAMIVYKNYHPQDFALLHRRAGKVYTCISSKPKFIEQVLSDVFPEKERILKEEYQVYQSTKNLRLSELRILYLLKLRSKISDRFVNFLIENQAYSFEQISSDAKLFEKLIKNNEVFYSYHYSYYNIQSTSITINQKEIDNEIDFSKRASLLGEQENIFKQKKLQLQKEKLRIRSLTLHMLITKYGQGGTDLYKGCQLSEMMDVFIRRGFIDENYYDYISYFYEGMVSLADRDLLMSIKRDISKGYTYHIDKIENFVKELLPYMFESNAILNNDLLNILAKYDKRYADSFILFMSRLEMEGASLDFLAQYYILGKEQSKVFKHYIEWDIKNSWRFITEWQNAEEKNTLIEGWLKFTPDFSGKSLKWLNNNYDFLTSRIESIGLTRCKQLVDDALFEELNNESSDLLDYAIEKRSYSINNHNLCVIINYLLESESQVTDDDLNLTIVRQTNNDNFVENVEENIREALPCFSMKTKNESQSSILFLLNNTDLTDEEKSDYLREQQNLLDDPDRIDSNEKISLAYKLFIIKPTWKNVESYFNNEQKNTEILVSYVDNYGCQLGKETIIAEEEVCRSLFNLLVGTNVLSLNSYREIIHSFNWAYRGASLLKDLEQKRLEVLLLDNKLPFCEENTDILKETAIYVDYLLFHNKAFLEAKDESFFINANIVLRVLESNKLTQTQKKDLIRVIPDNYLMESTKIANLVISIFVALEPGDLCFDIYKEILAKGTVVKNKVIVVTSLINTHSYEDSQISALLFNINDEYAEIAKRIKHPLLPKTSWDANLISTLSKKGYISSYKSEKEGIRVYPRKHR